MNIKFVAGTRRIRHFDPPDVFEQQVLLISSELEEATVLAQAYVEHLFWNNAGIKHRLIDGLLPVEIQVVAHAHSENTIGCLIIEQVCLLVDTPEAKHEVVMISAEIITEIDLILNHKT